MRDKAGAGRAGVRSVGVRDLVRARGVSLRLIVFLVAVACTSPSVPTGPPIAPSATPSAPATPAASSTPSAAPSATPATPAADRLALEECDPLGYVPCEHQAVLVQVPIAGTGVALTYSSEWAPGRTDRPAEWDAAGLGLGGWSLDVLQRFDAVNHVLLGGDGSWRLVDPTPLSGGGFAVPSFDGRLAYVFDGDGRHVRTVDAILGVDLLVFSYDGDGRLLGASGSLDSAPVDLTVERAANGEATSLVGGGAVTELTGDGAGHLGALTHPDGGREGLISTDTGLITAHLDPAGGVSHFEYDDTGRLAAATDADLVTLRYTRQETADEVEVTVTPPLGGAQTFRASRVDGKIETSYIGGDGRTTTLVESGDGELDVSRPDGTTVSIGRSPDERWGLAAPILTPLVEQRPDGTVRRIEIAQTITLEAGNPLNVSAWSRTITINGDAYVEQYDPAARSLSLTDPAGRATSQTYDEFGRLVGLTEPGRPPLARVYDAMGRLASETRGSGVLAATTSYSYDQSGAVAVTRPDGEADALTVDAAGRVVRSTSGGASTVLTTYDASGRQILVRPGERQATALGYSAAGRLTAVVPPVVSGDSSYEVLTYDQAGRLTAIAGPGERSILYAYDDMGRLDSLTFDRGELRLSYADTTGLLSGLAAPGGVVTAYTYAGSVPVGAAVSGPVAGSVALSLDARRRVVSESVDGGPAVPSNYDSGGALTGVGPVVLQRDATSALLIDTSLGVVETTRDYDANGLLVAATTSANGAPLMRFEYTRDALGRISSVIETGAVTATTAYGYDAAGRLASVTVNGVPAETDAYDAAGNRISARSPTQETLGSYDARDRLTQWGQVTYQHEPDGTLSRRSDGGAVTSFDFDGLGALRAVSLPDGTRVEYLVDGTGRRVGRMVGGTLVAGYLYRPDGLLVAELDGSSNVVARFAYDDRGRLMAVTRNGQDWLVVTDHLGSPRLVVDPTSGQVAEAITYDAWGNVTSDTNPGFQPFGFAGGLRDPDTGLVHFGARDYDPAVGRWTGPDPVRFSGGDANLYAYASSDPVNRTDRSGLQDGEDDIKQVLEPTFPEPACPECPPESGDIYPIVGDDSPPDNAGDTPQPGQQPPSRCWGALYCKDQPGHFTCIAVLCYPPGGGICHWYCSSGDPHLKTADGLALSFQGAGEYLMLTSADGSMVVQARQEPPFGLTQVTITTAVAAWVAGDRVGVYLGADGALSLHVNGDAVDGTEFKLALPHGGAITRQGTSFLVEWPDGSRLTVEQRGVHLDYGFTPDPAVAPTITGLLGTPDGDPGNDLVSRDGSLTLDPNVAGFFTQLHGPFGDSWRIGQDESLFDYGPGESTATFTRPEVPTQPAVPDAVESAARTSAEELCRAAGAARQPALDDCIVDVGLTGDSSYAASAATAYASTVAGAGPVHGSSSSIALDDTVVGMILGADQIDRYSFTGSTGDVVYLDSFGACSGELSWQLLGPAGEHLVAGLICNDLGPWTMLSDGTYTIEVYSPEADTGIYGFQLRTGP